MKYEETPREAIVRETREETNLGTASIKEPRVRAFNGRKASGFYRSVRFIFALLRSETTSRNTNDAQSKQANTSPLRV